MAPVSHYFRGRKRGNGGWIDDQGGDAAVAPQLTQILLRGKKFCTYTFGFLTDDRDRIEKPPRSEPFDFDPYRWGRSQESGSLSGFVHVQYIAAHIHT